ncbi:MAG TPA: ABC transporter permease subunit [Castellaniella sp.]|uniref:ABC transporter permease n=1 Tax=Castellaniella sp. TaxID=1955812 RepID=UPI002F1029BB
MVVRHPAMEAGSPRRYVPNLWDVFAFALILTLLILIYKGSREAFAPLASLQQHPVSLDPHNLPEYALRTTLRMLAAMVASLLFTFVYGSLAAKNRRAERILIPLLDILQSVPILGFISFTVVGFMALFPGQVMGAELAAIFAIFTSQAWNMTFSFYQSLKTVPADLLEASQSFRLSRWQQFWRLEVPFSMPGLVWNTMMSMSGGWFFVVASEAISVGNTTIVLPGIGSYVALAIEHQDLHAIAWAVGAMLGVILLYDQLLFRPLVDWSRKFRVELTTTDSGEHSWLLVMIRRSRLVSAGLGPLVTLSGALLRRRAPKHRVAPSRPRFGAATVWADRLWQLGVGLGSLFMLWHIATFVSEGASWAEASRVFGLGLITLLRVVVLTVLASLVWVPVGVWIGLHSRVAERVQPLAQFLAAFPANLMFPFVVVAIVRWHLTPDIWLSPLMILGTQWYILFNVIAGASAFPGDLKEAASNFHVGGWSWWRKVILPGVFPYYVTGAITATGGSWNASIVAEVASWGDTTLKAHGLGAYIAEATSAGDFPRVVLGIVVMTLFVTLLNRTVWHPLYRYAHRQLRLG